MTTSIRITHRGPNHKWIKVNTIDPTSGDTLPKVIKTDILRIKGDEVEVYVYDQKSYTIEEIDIEEDYNA